MLPHRLRWMAGFATAVAIAWVTPAYSNDPPAPSDPLQILVDLVACLKKDSSGKTSSDCIKQYGTDSNTQNWEELTDSMEPSLLEWRGFTPPAA